MAYLPPSLTIRLANPGTQLESSYFDVSILASSAPNPLFPSLGTLYDGWCLDTTIGTALGTNLKAYVYSSYELNVLREALPTLGTPDGANFDKLDSINWLLGAYNGSTVTGGAQVVGASYGDVQSAIWKMLGEVNFLSQPGTGAVNVATVDTIANMALTLGDNYLPDAGQALGVVLKVVQVDATSGAETLRQPIIIETRAAKIGDFVWHDLDANGRQDANEPGIAGVTVQLVRDLNLDGDFADPNEVLATTATSAAGAYAFMGLTPGIDYQVRFLTPAGFAATSPRQSDGSPASGVNSDGPLSNVVVLSAGQYNSTLDAGFYQGASLGDRIWVDTNGDGQQNDGTTGISGLSVTLIGGGADGLINGVGDTSAITTTGTDGLYQFTGLTPSVQYQVQFSKPAGSSYTQRDIGADTGDSDADPLTGRSQVVTLASGQNNPTLDAGVYLPATLGDRVWVDTNANGQQDAAETTNIAGVTVELYRCVNNAPSGALLASTTTNASGNYSFSGLAPGDYIVKFITPSGFVQTLANVGADSSDSDAVPGGLTGCYTLTSGQTNTTADAGFYQGASLGDRIWVDTNGDGQQNDGTTGISGLSVTLIGGGADGLINGVGDTSAITTTGTDGLYQFTGLTPSVQYQVQFSKPAGSSYTQRDIGADTGDSDADPLTGRSQVVTLASGQNNPTLDAGVYLPATLGDRVWVDTNANGQQDAAETTSIAGVTVELYRCVNNAPSGAPLASTTTNASGNYSFSGLAPGDYIVKFITPSGFVQTLANVGADSSDSDASTAGLTGCYTLTSGQTNTTADAGFYQGASLGDRIWVDTNGDGQQNDGTTGISGLSVTLIGGGADGLINGVGDTSAITTTGTDGLYQFTGLTPSVQYQVQFSKPAGSSYTQRDIGADTGDSDADPLTGRSQVVTLASGQNNPTLDAGVYLPATLGDRVWVDTNANGQQDAAETTSIAGVTVELYRCVNNAPSGALLASTTTNASGNYSFSGLAPGDYIVKFITPSGFVQTLANVGADSSDSDAVPGGLTGCYTLTSGQTNTTADAGFYQGASLGDRIWVDTNGDGQQNDGTTGISGLSVTLIGGGADGLINGVGDTSAITTTGTDGLYQFTGLTPSVQYQVQFSKPAGSSYTQRDIGADTGDSDADPLTGRSQVVTLASGQNNPTLDAGVYLPATLGDRVWVDTNANGQQDAAETTSIAGVTVELYRCVNNAPSGALLASTTTNASGNYSFSGLAPGDYIVKFITPSGFVQTLANVGADSSDSDASTAGLTGCYTLTSGQTNTTADAGFYQGASLGDRIWVDTNGDGQQNDGTTGISGLSVTLIGGGADGLINGVGDTSAITTTGTDGLYQFTGLTPSVQYQVQFSKPAGSSYTQRDIGADTGDSDADPLTGRSQVVTLASGQNNPTLDAGVYLPATLGDRVWVDTNANGQQDATETTNIAGVTVELYRCVNNAPSGALLASTTTNASGNYSFSGLAPGDYIVKFITPSGFVQTLANVGADSSDSDASTAGLTGCYTLTSGQTNTTADAGFYQGASLGDRIWVDTNGDGQQNDGTTGISGLSVTLIGGGADGLINGVGDTSAITTTGTDGLYQFTGLTPSVQYQVQFSKPAGSSYTQRDIGADTGDSDADPLTGRSQVVTLASGQNNPTLDAGVYLPATLGDRVWVDTNANGQQDATETTSIAGVTVELYRCVNNAPSGALLASTTTNASGNYSFSGLAPGDYIVKFITPSGFVQTLANVGADSSDSDASTAGLTGCYTLTSGQTNTTADAGYVAPLAVDLVKSVRVDAVDCPTGPMGAGNPGGPAGGIDLGNLTKYLFFFANGSQDANWQGATKGFAGDVVVDGVQAAERTSGGVPFAGTVYTNDATLGAWQNIVNQNAGQASAVTGQSALVSQLETDLTSTFTQINSLAATAGFTSVAATSLNGLNTQDGVNRTYVINITSGFGGISSKINITGDAGDVFVMRWDSDANPGNGYQGQVKFQSGGAIVPLGGLTAGNFVHTAGDINASGGGSTPASPYPQGPRLDDGTGALIDGASNFSGGGYFTGYWLTTGDPSSGDTSSLSNGIFVGGWYTLSDKFSMTSGTSGAHVCVNGATLGTSLGTDANFNPANIGVDANLAPFPRAELGDRLTYTYKVTNSNGVPISVASLIDDNATPANAGDNFAPVPVRKAGGLNFGDVDNDGQFDPGESWYYQASQFASVAGTRTNVAVVNATSPLVAGTATDSDPATVVIGAVQPSLGDFLWSDTNANGLQDAGEAGIGGITVTLIGGGSDGLINGVGDTTATTQTGSDGFYEFAGLTSAVQYQVQFAKPAGTVFTTRDAGGNAFDSLDSDTDPATGRTAIVTLAAGENNPTLDAGVYTPAGGIQIIKDAAQTIVAPGVPVTFTYSVSNTGSVPISNVAVRDDSATPDYLDDDFAPAPVLGAAGKNIGDLDGDNLLDTTEIWRYSATSIPPVNMTVTLSAGAAPIDSGTLLYSTLANGDVRINYLQSSNFNDNTYGTGSDAGWTSQGKTHKFGDLTGSDKAGFEVRATDGTILFKFYQDYITASTTNIDGYSSYSGYQSLGISGGEGGLENGGTLNAQAGLYLKDFDSTLETNLNQPGFANNGTAYTGMILNSPVGDAKWNVVNGYSFVIDKAAFTATGKTFGGARIFDQHNSPAKVGGSNSYVPDVVGGASVNTATVSGVGGGITLFDDDDATVIVGAGPLGSIGDRVWFDTDADGRQDAGEAGLSGVGVTINADFDGNGTADYSAATLTGANGLYLFTNLPAGTYAITVDTATLPANFIETYDLDGLASPHAAMATLAGGQARTDLDFGYVAGLPGFTLLKTADKASAAFGEPVTYGYQVRNTSAAPLTGVVLKDDNGTPGDASDDFAPLKTGGDTVNPGTLDPGETWTYSATVTPPIQLVANNINGYTGPAGTLSNQVLANGDIRVSYRQSTNVNDNNYASSGNAPSWNRSHSFGDLTGSDKAGFELKDKSGTTVMKFYMDYITSSSTQEQIGSTNEYAVYSGYRSLGVSGGDGSISVGSAANMYDFDSTLELNLNRAGYTTTTTNSPLSDSNWDYVNGYAFTVKAAAFGASGFGSAAIFDQHNSPSKLGTNSFVPTPTGGEVTNTAVVSAFINGSPVVAVDDATVIVGPTSNGGQAKFFVADIGADDVYKYAALGAGVGNFALQSGNTDPRDIAANVDGSKLWVLDKDKNVNVYSSSGGALGVWKADGLGSEPEGLTLDPSVDPQSGRNDLWIASRDRKIDWYDDAASNTTGTQASNLEFAPSMSGNLKGIVTDGNTLWAVTEGGTDTVYRFAITRDAATGNPTALTQSGLWVLPVVNAKPTGITVDPTGASQSIWIVDESSDTVYEYANARSLTSGTAVVAASFKLGPNNLDAQGIADPMVVASTPVPDGATAFGSFVGPVLLDDTALAALRVLAPVGPAAPVTLPAWTELLSAEAETLDGLVGADRLNAVAPEPASWVNQPDVAEGWRRVLDIMRQDHPTMLVL